MAANPKQASTASGAPARLQAALAQIAQGKALTAAPYNLTAAQAQAVGVAALTAILARDDSMLNALVHILVGK